MIEKLGRKLVKCKLNCMGISNNPKLGIIPRCLNIEKRTGRNKCIVVGLNPGNCKERERQYYLEKGIKYKSIDDYFNKENLNYKKYYKRTKDLIALLGFQGDILWTELAKCESAVKGKKPHILTFRVCINRFLRKELKCFNCKIIFALGNFAFEFCALSFPDHFVVGLPHPSGSFGNFNALLKDVSSRKGKYKKIIAKTKDSNGYFTAVQLKRPVVPRAEGRIVKV